jgi:hypothetical protein
MKATIYTSLIIFTFIQPLFSEKEPNDAFEILERHAEGSELLAGEQDELSADVQQLVIEQTVQQVIDLLTEVEGIMDETTDYLAETETGGTTIAAQTEIIEKIYEAAKEKQKKGQGEKCESGSAMLDMMERMMGKKEGEGKGKGKGEGEGDQGGNGQTGDSDSANEADGGNIGGKNEERTVPKAAGNTGKTLPSEFQQALDAYNRGLEKKSE